MSIVDDQVALKLVHRHGATITDERSQVWRRVGTWAPANGVSVFDAIAGRCEEVRRHERDGELTHVVEVTLAPIAPAPRYGDKARRAAEALAARLAYLRGVTWGPYSHSARPGHIAVVHLAGRRGTQIVKWEEAVT
jgi:hypothetical protein